MGYYMGDFYSGDPGFFSLLGRAAKGAVGLVRGFAGLPGKAPRALPAAAGVAAAGAITGAASTAIQRVGGALTKHPVLSAAGAAGTIGVLGGLGAGAAMRPMPMAGMRGFHMSKPQHIPKNPAPHLVKNRHMRVTNPKALHRALRRAHGFARVAMKTIKLVHPQKKGRFGGFKKRARKR